MTRAWLTFFLAILVITTPHFAFAQSATDLQAQIDANNKVVESLKADIATYQKQLDVIGKQKSTLQSAVSQLTVSAQQLAAQIKVTQSQITSANLRIQELSSSISDKESTIASNQLAIGKALRTVSQTEQTPFLAKMIAADSLGDAWQVADRLSEFNRALQQNIAALRTVRTELSNNRDEVSAQKANLLSLQNDLTLQKRSVDANKAAQQKLLSDTKNQESNYQKLLAQKKAAEQTFEDQLIALQSQLDLIVHPGSLPKVGSGVLHWPFSDAFMSNCGSRQGYFGNLFCITQYFGNTPFSTANPQVYNGHGHNAIDLAAPIGTPVHAALTGTVLGTGNTDLNPGCYSFGKWIMIQHNNGLNTMYAHLSSIDVVKGQTISTGQIIGLSGMTGYATGPHIHFGVYATQGTKIQTLGQFRGATGGCANASMPVATLDAYLNPLSYL